jgi:hypothetical protein
MEQVKAVIREQLEKNKFFDQLRAAVSKDPRLAQLDRGAIIDKIKSEGIINEIVRQLPLPSKPSAGGTPVD